MSSKIPVTMHFIFMYIFVTPKHFPIFCVSVCVCAWLGFVYRDPVNPMKTLYSQLSRPLQNNQI